MKMTILFVTLTLMLRQQLGATSLNAVAVLKEKENAQLLQMQMRFATNVGALKEMRLRVVSLMAGQ